MSAALFRQQDTAHENRVWWLAMPARIADRRRALGYPVGSPERRMLEGEQ